MDYKLLKDECTEWVRNWFDNNGPGCSAVIGMSGGKDSTVAAAICAEALGKDRVIGVAMPSGQQSINDADKICEYLGIEYIQMNIGKAESAMSELGRNVGPMGSGGVFSTQTVQNIPPRIRMATLYAVAQTRGGMVANTCNLSEDYIGYATLFGDAAGSFSPLRNLCVREIRGIGHALGLPSRWVDKVPDDGLPDSCPDEEKFGFTYDTLDAYIRDGVCDDEPTREKIVRMHKRNIFKTEILHIPSFDPKLPVFEEMSTVPAQVRLKHVLNGRSETVSAAESCTGGRISHLITTVSGSSTYYLGSVTSYAIPLKEKLLAVPDAIIQRCGVVSKEVAEAMAVGVIELTGSTYSVAITGWADKTGDSHEGPGTAWVAVAEKSGKVLSKRLLADGKPSDSDFRTSNISQFARDSLNFLVDAIIDWSKED